MNEEKKHTIDAVEEYSQELKLSHIENGIDLDLGALIEERHFNHKTVFENDIPIVSFNGIKALSLGNFSVISGKPKAGKGFSLSLIIDGFLNDNDVIDSNYQERKKVVHIDTEQSGNHAQRLTNTVGKLGGNNDLIDGYWFRGVAPEPLIKIVDILIEKHHKDAGVFIIDGIRDLSRTGVNDQEESTRLFNKLLHWTQAYNIHIIVVIHQNKADKNATGYLGGDMVKKAELHLSVTKDKTDGTYTIEAEDTRDAPVDSITFMLDNDIKPIVVEGKQGSIKKKTAQEYDRSTHIAVLKRIFNKGKGLTRQELKNKIMYEYNVGDNKANTFIEYFIDPFNKLMSEEGTRQKRQYILSENNRLI